MMTFLDICAGIGGFSLGFSQEGFKCVYQVEKNEQCRNLLARHFPDVPRHGDMLTFADEHPDIRADVLALGDPCPKHSRARSNGKSKHPDLSGYGLAMVGRLRPRWVVRENVPAPTVAHFALGLEHLGYGTVVIRMDSAPYSGQARERDYILARDQTSAGSLRRCLYQFPGHSGRYSPRVGTRDVISCLTTNRKRYDSCDNYVWHPEEQVLRILDGEERETFAGFPRGWAAGLSEAACARVFGNAVTPACAQKIAQVIKTIEAM